MNILVVDDDEKVLEFLTQVFASTKHKITKAKDGEEAFKIFKDQEFSVVISDIRMPKMNGIELLERIKNLEKGKYVDFIILTGYSDVKNSMEALKLGAYEYFKKPFNPKRLLKTINRIEDKNSIFKIE